MSDDIHFLEYNMSNLHISDTNEYTINVLASLFGHGRMLCPAEKKFVYHPLKNVSLNLIAIKPAGISNIVSRESEEYIDSLFEVNKNAPDLFENYNKEIKEAITKEYSTNVELYKDAPDENRSAIIRSKNKNPLVGYKKNYGIGLKRGNKEYTGVTKNDITLGRRHRGIIEEKPLVKIYSVIVTNAKGQEVMNVPISDNILHDITNNMTLDEIVSLIQNKAMLIVPQQEIERIENKTNIHYNVKVNFYDNTCNVVNQPPLGTIAEIGFLDSPQDVEDIFAYNIAPKAISPLFIPPRIPTPRLSTPGNIRKRSKYSRKASSKAKSIRQSRRKSYTSKKRWASLSKARNVIFGKN